MALTEGLRNINMRRAKIIKTILGLVVIALIIKAALFIFVQPWLRNKVETVFNEGNYGHTLKIDKVRLSLITAGVEFESLSLFSKYADDSIPDSVGVIASVKIKGINVYKALFNKSINVKELSLSGADVKVLIPIVKKEKPKMVSDWDILVDKIYFNQINIAVGDQSSAKSFTIKNGFMNITDFQVFKLDTLTVQVIENFDLSVQRVAIVSPDSMYTYRANDFRYSSFSKQLTADTIQIVPNYTYYNFTSRYNYETDCIEAKASNIIVHNFSIKNYLKSGDIITPAVEIGMVDVEAFRDKRKPFKHINKLTFQDLMYNYKALLRVDSMNIMGGNITYIEHGEESNEAGYINFNDIKAIITNITNDTTYKKEPAFFDLQAKGLLMGKGKLSVHLKSKIFDPQNLFSLEGSLTSMDIKALNPMLENNAFVSALSGTINSMDFNFSANNTKATGNLAVRYNDFNLKVLNKESQESNTKKAGLKSFVANVIVVDSNPIPGKDVRIGVIDYNRDPEKFVFNYCFKSILSGIKTSIIK
jgi:hypothetical protein